ncbi:hypothetical protein [Rubellicoccus peritrichatus]|uniref:Verru_Chthon cassette protein A n=1 Tax=Rubellicoccus peritrichatus TaxID=3080537 RepID=A0AAQ3LAG7_9BACT|nr:hypothetical protein [Puniceicoccus sp. CR14]WOO40627.1 hypothetical protein RZN69_18550 [Puniceicoccus sp. CR14]
MSKTSVQNRRRPSSKSGFALLVTLMLMAFLLVLGISLTAIVGLETQATQTAQDIEKAQQNALAGLQVALGQLQETAGHDQRITASGQYVDDTASPALTGVWRSHEPNPRSPSGDADANFLRWLVSHPNRSTLEDGSQIPDTTGGVTALLIGEGSLGPDMSSSQELWANVLEISGNNGEVVGGFAYAVMDEGAKARVDLTPSENVYGDIGLQAALGEARRFGVEAINDLGNNGFKWWTDAGQDRLLTLSGGQSLEGSPDLREFNHDLTTWSRGLLTDVARGGFKNDLSVLFDGTLPSQYAGNGIYEDFSVDSAAANPRWDLLQEYATLYKDIEATSTDEGGYQAQARLPAGHQPYEEVQGNIEARPSPALGHAIVPVLTKLEIVFSAIVRDPHGGWAGNIAGLRGDGTNYMLHMIYSPIVTIYNPHNLPIEFRGLKISFADIPIGFQFYVNGQPQLNAPAPLNQLNSNHDENSNTTQQFTIDLVSSLGATSSMVIQPGETMVFGTAVTPDWSWQQEINDDYSTMFDWRNRENSLSDGMELAPGWNTEGVGFDIDWLVPPLLRSADAPIDGVLPLSGGDRVDVGFQPMQPQSSDGRFSVTVDLIINTSGDTEPAGVIEFHYRDINALSEVLSHGRLGDDQYPVRLERARTALELYEASGTPFRDYVNAWPFALFSLSSKTTLDSGSPSKPGVFHSPASYITKLDPEIENPAVYSYEASLLPVRSSSGVEIDEKNRGFAFTGHSLGTGVRAFPIHEIPMLPIQSIAQLRHANLASSGHLPNFTYTVGESWASPLIPKNAVSTPLVEESNSGGQGSTPEEQEYAYLDHTWLSNNELWDSYYFSTICGYDGAAFGGSQGDLDEVLTRFMNGEKPLFNERLTPSLSSDANPTEVANQLASDPELYRKSAAYLWLEGPFNINSVSVNAWKAVLGSLNQRGVSYYDALGEDSEVVSEVATNPLPRHRRPVGPATDGESIREERWRGFRVLDNDQIDDLANAIVAVVKERGPFLSLAEFVNRNPDGSTREALKGPLQEAIDNSRINEMFSEDSQNIELQDIEEYDFAFPETMLEDNLAGAAGYAAGAAGYVTQGDILSALGTTLSARSDTFRIRAYGETSRLNQVVAKAWCEAVVQRVHEYVDPADAPDVAPADLSSQENIDFGRGFKIVSFRWLDSDEV